MSGLVCLHYVTLSLGSVVHLRPTAEPGFLFLCGANRDHISARLLGFTVEMEKKGKRDELLHSYDWLDAKPMSR